jgi:hypothetical protein
VGWCCMEVRYCMIDHAATSAGLLAPTAAASALFHSNGASVIALPTATATIAIPGADEMRVTIATGLTAAGLLPISEALLKEKIARLRYVNEGWLPNHMEG